jgi:hypothetical protein
MESFKEQRTKKAVCIFDEVCIAAVSSRESWRGSARVWNSRKYGGAFHTPARPLARHAICMDLRSAGGGGG